MQSVKETIKSLTVRDLVACTGSVLNPRSRTRRKFSVRFAGPAPTKSAPGTDGVSNQVSVREDVKGPGHRADAGEVVSDSEDGREFIFYDVKALQAHIRSAGSVSA